MLYFVIRVDHHPYTVAISQHETLEKAIHECARLNHEDGWRDRYKVVRASVELPNG